MSTPAQRTISLLGLLFCWVAVAATPDKSGVKPSTISLPSGAGSIEGLGESFEPQLNTGSSSYGVGMSLPPGRAGLQPKVRLAYNSGTGNSIAGLGWSCEFPTIKRQTDKGFPTYTAADVFVFSGEELVPLNNPDADWRCENESGFQRFRQIDTDGDFYPDAWEMTDRNGTRHIFGQYRGAGNRWSVVAHPSPPAAAQTAFDRTYCWALNTTIDLHGNRIEYEYLPPNGDPDSSGVLYPSRIRYSFLNDNYHEVRFAYEDRPDKFDDYRPTFSVTIGKRLAAVEVYSHYDGADHLVRSYGLEYAYRPEDGITLPPYSLNLGVSTLKRFVQYDRSGGSNNYLPPLLFEYSQMDLNAAQLRSISPPELEIAEAGGNVQIADVNGDSLPDIIKTADSITGEQILCLNQGEFASTPGGAKSLHFGPAQVIVPSSSNFRLSDVNSTLTDVDGDGLTDFVRIDPGDITGKQLYIYPNNSRLDGNGSLGFATTPQVQFSAPPEIAFNNPIVRQMDVNFDKQSDFVLLDQDFISSFHYYYRDRDSGAWVHSGPVFFNPDMSGYGITFDAGGEANPRVHLADMNGDRLLDLVYLDTSGSGIGTTLTIRYWPYCGLGRWGAMRLMTLAVGDNFQIDALDLRDVLVQDLTGDGLADIAVIRSDGGSSSSLDLRVNIAGRAFATPTTLYGLPRHLPRDPSSPTTFRQADLNANGSTDLIWRNQGLFQNDWQWLELLPDGKPNLLVRIDNNLGKQTEITYGNAVDDMIRAREAGYPWKTWCPFSMQVVRRIRTTCGFDLDGVTDSLGTTTDHYVSKFQYRDAYYDGFEREFRGFAFAQRIDYGDDFLLTNSLAHPMGEGWGEGFTRSPGWDATKTPTGQLSAPTLVTRFRYLTGAADGADNDEYPGGWPGPFLVDEVSPKGGREEEILKGRQVWEEKIDPWVLHEPAQTGDFDRGCWLALNSTNASELTRMTPDALVYSRARQEWAIRRLYRPNDPALAPPGRFAAAAPAIRVQDGLGGSGRSVSFAFVSNLTNEVIEANGILSLALSHPLRNPIVTAKSNDYDDYGNETAQRDYGVVSAGSYDDERFTTTEFALQGEALDRWILDKPARTRTTDENGVFVSESRHYYDGSQFQGLPLGQIGSRALSHRAEQVVTDVAALPPLTAQSDQPGDPRLPAGTVIQTARSAFDAYGNVLATLDPLGNPANLSAGHAHQLAYDSTFQTYPTSETIVVGGGSSNLVITANYDLGFGVITSSTDFNNNVSSYEYDSFARLVAMVKPFDTPTYPTALFQYFPGDPNRARVYSYDRAGNLTVTSPGNLSVSSRVVSRLREKAGQPGTYVSVSYTDGLGRKLADVKESDVAGQWIVSSAQSYNRRLTSQSSWLPYEIGNGGDDSSPPHFGQFWPAGRPPLTSLNGDPTVKSDKRYDPLGREIITINPAESLASITNETARTRSITQLLPFEKRLFDENDADLASPYHDTPMVQFMDGLGRLTKVLETVRLNDDGTPGGSVVEWPTQYRYDLNDNLTHITDSQGNEKWFRYDGLKRKLFMNDPDRGTMTYTYDDASNLRSTLDAKSQTIAYAYDGVNRLKTEDYHDGQPVPPWRFPLPLGGGEGQGEGATNDVVYHYDVPYPNLPIGDGTTATASNTKGMLAWVQDLSGEEHTSYDPRGRVEFVVKRIPDPQFLSAISNLPTPLVSYRTGFAYDSLDRVTTLTYADNDQVSYLYNARNLLSRITGGPSGSIISNIVYRPSDQLRQIDYGNGVQTFYDYDPRLRLNSLLTHHASRITEPLINFAYDFDGVSNIKSITDNRPVSAVPAGDARRNTQLFQYDDLYRITRAQYSFAAPGAISDNGSINYRYDRIGNMLAQHSDIAHFEKGASVTELGDMSYGGAAGKSGRIGRAASDQPGPHALTAVSQLATNSLQPRVYPYDDNGNMTGIDGLTNTWDFKDRLVAVESSAMRAVYTYDYTYRRILKRVWKKNSLSAGGEGQGEVESVLYPDKYFEVREHDAPTKYVWNSNTRVARVAGSLNTNQRVQRLRLWPGWNLVSLAVSSPSPFWGEGRGEVLSAAFRWNQPTLTWLPVATNEALAAGTVLWLRASTNATATVTGTYTPPVNATSPTGPSFQPGAGLEAWPFTKATLLDLVAWKFDGPSQTWLVRYGTNLPGQSDFPVTLAVGEGFMARADAATTLEVPESALRICYYHQDRLGSSTCLSAADGSVVVEYANFAFGTKRSRDEPKGLSEAYFFTQKENDAETELNYFETRYQSPTVARFLSVDALSDSVPQEWRAIPQKLNSYAFCQNRPTFYIDPRGLDGREPTLTVYRLYRAESSDAYTRTSKKGDYTYGKVPIVVSKGVLEQPIPLRTKEFIIIERADNFAPEGASQAKSVIGNDGLKRVRLDREIETGKLRDLHVGNHGGDSQGCPLIGRGFDKQLGIITDSKSASDEVYNAFKDGGTVKYDNSKFQIPFALPEADTSPGFKGDQGRTFTPKSEEKSKQ